MTFVVYRAYKIVTGRFSVTQQRGLTTINVRRAFSLIGAEKLSGLLTWISLIQICQPLLDVLGNFHLHIGEYAMVPALKLSKVHTDAIFAQNTNSLSTAAD